MKYLKSIAKATLLMFAVGALLALAAPSIADLTGIAANTLAHSADPLWLGSFFGAFGGIHAALVPVLDRAFGDQARKATETVKTEEKTQVKLDLSPELSQPAVQTASHCRYIETERSSAPTGPQIL